MSGWHKGSFLTALLLVPRWELQSAKTSDGLLRFFHLDDADIDRGIPRPTAVRKGGTHCENHKGLVETLYTRGNACYGTDVTHHHIEGYHASAAAGSHRALYCHGATRIAGMSHFLTSISVGPEVRFVNLIVADMGGMNPASLATLITTLADYVVVVDVGAQQPGAPAADRTKMLDMLSDVVMPAAVAARATVLGLVQEWGTAASGGSEVRDLLTNVAAQAGLPCHVEVGSVAKNGSGVASDVVNRMLPRLLYDALPPAGSIGPCTPMPADSVVRFLTYRSDVAIGVVEEAASVDIGDGADELLGLDVVAHPLMPPLKANYRLRASLPFRCVMLSNFPQRKVALMYVVQGTLRCGESLLAANLHYMGVRPDSWPDSRLVDDCRVSSILRYPTTEPLPEGEAAYPGEFITVQLEGSAVASSTRINLLDVLPTWSVCGKFPVASDPISAFFPRPFAVAQWSLSGVYRHTNNALQTKHVDIATLSLKEAASVASRSSLVGCGQVGLHQSHMPGMKHDPQVFLNCLAQNTNIGFEATYDSHVHMLAPDCERRAVLVIRSSGAAASVAIVVRVSVLLRKLSLLISVAAAVGKQPPGRLLLTPTVPEAEYCREVIKLVERVGVIGTRYGQGVASVRPVDAAAADQLRLAAGHELAYGLPSTLLLALGVFDVDCIPQANLKTALLEGCEGANQFNQAPVVTENPTEPINDTKFEPGSFVGMWGLLAVFCELRHIGFGCSLEVESVLMQVGLWASSIRHSPLDATLYMSGRQKDKKAEKQSPPPTPHFRAASGLTMFPFLSDHTREMWKRFGGLLPFESVWRVTMPLLMVEWEAGATVEAVRSLAMLGSAVTRLSKSELSNKHVMLKVWSMFWLLLRTDGCSEAAAEKFVSVLWELSTFRRAIAPEAEKPHHIFGPSVGKVCLPIDNSLQAIDSVFQCEDYFTDGPTKYRISPAFSKILLSWYSAVGGWRVLQACLYQNVLTANHYSNLRGRHLCSVSQMADLTPDEPEMRVMPGNRLFDLPKVITECERWTATPSSQSPIQVMVVLRAVRYIEGCSGAWKRSLPPTAIATIIEYLK